jgi:hypothetical protein
MPWEPSGVPERGVKPLEHDPPGAASPIRCARQSTAGRRFALTADVMAFPDDAIASRCWVYNRCELVASYG